MVFSSTVFLFLFFPLILCIYYNPWVTGRKFRNIFLLLASLGFYAWGEPVFVFLMMLSICVGYFVGLHLQAPKRKYWLTAGICFHVGLLFIFKYLTFVLGQIGLLVGSLEGFKIALPIGISFFTFQLLSYLFDVYYGKAKAQHNILNLGLYIALFPQLIAGPIVRYETISDEIMVRKENLTDFSEGMLRFIYGLAKKMLIANYMGQLADTVFDMHGSLSVGTAWLGAVAYTLQIYFDFSGYSDMAIGLGRMFGFHFAENFNYPYIAKSATDFWRRWHISLGSWFRDYVYIPLGGNRCSSKRWVLNLFIVWALTGIWHGANYTFLTWGLFYFVLLLVERLTHFHEKIGRFSHIYAMIAVILGWVMFRSDNLAMGIHYIDMMFGVGSLGLTDKYFWLYLGQTYSVLTAGIIFSLPILPWLKKQGGNMVNNLEPLVALGLFVLTLVVAVSASYNPFIYFNF